MRQYLIDGKTFKTIKSAQHHIRQILKNVGICKSLKKKDKPIFERLKRFLGRHHDAIKKGILDQHQNNIVEDIQITTNMKGDLSLRFVKEDGDTSQDVSWLRCINPKQRSHWQKLSSAMRNSIQDQIKEFQQQTEKKCENSGCKKEQIQKYHVDHQIRFKQLQLDFLKLRSEEQIKDFDDCLLTNQKKFKKQNQKWKEEWQQFHKKNAKLRWLCQTCNLKRSKLLNSREQ